VSAALPQNDAAPQPRSAASLKTNSAEESHISSKTQTPAQVGPRLYQLKPICPGFSTTGWIKLRRWQRMKDHARWITDFILEAHERTLFVTVTFSQFVSDKNAKEAGRRFLQKRLSHAVEAYVRVIERQGNGRAHIHWIFRLVASAIACGCKIIQLSIKWHGRSFGFGRCQVEPVWHPERLAWYLVKSFKEGALRATGKVVTYSSNIHRMKYATDSCRWQHAVTRFAEKLGCATKEELTKKLGIGWPFRYRRQIYSIGARA
jgi:hypothetical protein